MGTSVLDLILMPAKKIVTQRFLSPKLLYYKHLLFEALGSEPVIIYTMGKVGSKTVFHTFQKQYVFPLVYHVHHLSNESFKSAVERYRKINLNLPAKVNLLDLLKGNSSHISASRVLRNPKIADSERKWNIITLVRDPFSTYLSHLFQNPQLTRPFLLNEDGLLDKYKVECYINDTFSDFDTEKDFISNWFDREFFQSTGVDLYRHSFNKEMGYSVIRENRFNIVILSLESLDKNLPLVLKEFNKSSNETYPTRENVRSENDQAGFYRDLKAEIKVSRKGLEKFYSTKYANHFFSAEFRSNMVDKWALK